MSKIKIGDKVRVVSGSWVEKCAGRVGVCVEIRCWAGNNAYDFGPGFDGWWVEGYPATCWAAMDEDVKIVAKASYEVGDRVRLTEVNTRKEWGNKGDVGTVRYVGKIPCVFFDRLKDSWWAKAEILELADAGEAGKAEPVASAQRAFKRSDKVRFVRRDGSDFTQGKIYEVGGEYYDESNTRRVGLVANDKGVADGWLAEFFELVAPVTKTPVAQTAAPPPVSIGQRLRIIEEPGVLGGYKAGDIVEVKGIDIEFKDCDNYWRTRSVTAFAAVSDEELAKIDAEASHENTLKRLREKFTPQESAFKIGEAVIINDDEFTNKPGVVLEGPDEDEDYKVGFFGNDNSTDWLYFAADDLQAA
jgi:hypothetical protein